MKKVILNFCYRILIKTRMLGVVRKCLSQRISYSSEISRKEEFGGSYNVITTIAKSSLLRGKIIGSVYSQSGYWEEVNYDYCVLKSLWVHPLLQKRGIGLHLVNLCIENAQSVGFKYIMLNCFDGNLAAKSLYEKRGFTNLNSSTHLECDAPLDFFEKERLYAQEVLKRPILCYWIKL